MQFKVQPAPPALLDVPYKVGEKFFLQSELCVPEYYVSQAREQGALAPVPYLYVFTRCSNTVPYLYKYDQRGGG